MEQRFYYKLWWLPGTAFGAIGVFCFRFLNPDERSFVVVPRDLAAIFFDIGVVLLIVALFDRPKRRTRREAVPERSETGR